MATASHHPHPRPARPVLLLVAGLAITMTGCGTARPEPGGRPTARLGRCPPPLLFGSATRPRGIRVTNRTGEPVMVFLDQCRGHQRVADLRVSETRLFRLPDRLVETRGGLTFHSFLKTSLRYHSTVTVPVDTAVVLELELAPWEEVSECDPVVYVDGAVWERPVREIPGEIRGVTVRDPSGAGECREYRFRTR